MFNFPQPCEQYYSDSYASVTVVGILEKGIPWDLPYRCPGIGWNPHSKAYTILMRISSGGQVIELPLSCFIKEFTCVSPDEFKRNQENRFSMLQIITDDPILQIWREKNIHHYPDEKITVIRNIPVGHSWRDISRPEPDISYRNYL
ncbi:hypothetical protein [uncultured Cedecea sp.]|uniref:hypothetical protein n=1 Tax=uncultured Cedecea sp. TaxID=988762 RepID=UPI0026064A35|nr:hypothetical protein [uncultured Cedecea sp.]